jgi:hypothetical protein
MEMLSLCPLILAILAPWQFLARDRYGSVIKALSFSDCCPKLQRSPAKNCQGAKMASISGRRDKIFDMQRLQRIATTQ